MPTALTLNQMKAFVREHFEDFVNKRNASVIRKNMTPDFHDHDGPGGKPTGVEGDEQMMVAMYKAMPDLRVTVEDMIAEGALKDLDAKWGNSDLFIANSYKGLWGHVRELGGIV